MTAATPAALPARARGPCHWLNAWAYVPLMVTLTAEEQQRHACAAPAINAGFVRKDRLEVQLACFSRVVLQWIHPISWDDFTLRAERTIVTTQAAWPSFGELRMTRSTSTPAWLPLALLAALTLSTVLASDRSSTSGSGDSGNVTIVHRPLVMLDARSGLRTWVDPTTPDDALAYTSSRGDKWELVMSDEFGLTNRSFKPGEDHLWTTLEKPDGVNGALELYSHDMASVVCDTSDDNGANICFLQIKVIDEINNISIYNQYTRPPTFQNSSFFYRAAMLQSWNKFCFQGGMLEVRAQLPGAVSAKSLNPDIGKGPNARALSGTYYPTWPGLWLMGNLGRAIFSASTQRMWPFSYNQCDENILPSYNQRISACNGTPGHGLNPYQGRGAPEIDLLEGGGVAISSSIQIGPGLKPKFRRIAANSTIEGGQMSCYYAGSCKTLGANLPNVPTAVYAKRKYQSWHAGLRYAANNQCTPTQSTVQNYAAVTASVKRGITDNKCALGTCPGANDVLSDLGLIDGNASRGHWGVNEKGTCFPEMNAYQGGFLCDPDNQNPNCVSPRNDSTAKTNTMATFDYQMDALSANWGIHVAAYTSFLTYQLEWVMGDEGYIRWMLHGNPIFEIPAESVINVGQDETRSNPVRLFPEEPMYVVMNVALSDQWGAIPPNPGKPCRGNGKNPATNRICDSFPMHMKIDYVRLYQDTSTSSTMALGCDPKTHPTRQWIQDHIKDYTDDFNTHKDVNGGARCRSNKDCTISWSLMRQFQTGYCNSRSVCECSNQYWGGPRCTYQLQETSSNGDVALSSYGPPLYASAICAAIGALATLVVIVLFARKRRAQLTAKREKAEEDRIRELRDAPDEPMNNNSKSYLMLPLDLDDDKGLETSKSATSSYSLVSGV